MRRASEEGIVPACAMSTREFRAAYRAYARFDICTLIHEVTLFSYFPGDIVCAPKCEADMHVRNAPRNPAFFRLSIGHVKRRTP